MTIGVGIEDMRTYQANRELGRSRAGERVQTMLPRLQEVVLG